MNKETELSLNSEGNALIVGGSNGVGLAVATIMTRHCHVTIVDKQKPAMPLPANTDFIEFDLTAADFSVFDNITNVNKLVITAGFGKLSLFKDYTEDLLVNMMNVNATAAMRIIYHFYHKIAAKEDFYCAVMVSIAGFMSSPFFSVYGASKAALKIFIESLNVELRNSGTTNRILNVSPGSLKGTSFNGGKTDTLTLLPFAEELIERMMRKEDLFIPQYEEVFKDVLARYAADFRAEGQHSYEYKLNSGRIDNKPNRHKQ